MAIQKFLNNAINKAFREAILSQDFLDADNFFMEIMSDISEFSPSAWSTFRICFLQAVRQELALLILRILFISSTVISNKSIGKSNNKTEFPFSEKAKKFVNFYTKEAWTFSSEKFAFSSSHFSEFSFTA